ncbi:transcriptional regulator [Rhizobium leguminosarum bv. trifolii WSM2297]|uniref:Transcriptional regulator n=1 Tax=Rhizobium leguminosarum bv. trifolii WSM2297 TaxID=754762 RepID=J0CJQ5_RHILT|nr:TetR/AcrR family transcriptional regulator [Rhizobium leguminosarum]EJC79690.1 transcriptional regulator [Rhizobium leguminosarum bv. trifolii WSM2297]
MRPTREQARENRRRIIETAAQLFRENGIHAVGVDAVMKGAGLTHGGFYGHFKSKDELTAEAVSHAMRESLESEPPFGSIAEFAAAYLSREHRDASGEGCTIAALGPELARLPGEKRGSVTEYVIVRVRQMEKLQSTEGGASDRRKAIADLSSMIGALVMARAVGDEELSNEILEETRQSLSGGKEAM